MPLSNSGDATKGEAKADLDKLQTVVNELKGAKPIVWDTSNELFNAIQSAKKVQKPAAETDFSCTTALSPSQAYIFHVKRWTNDTATPVKGGQLVSSDWYTYHYKKSTGKHKADTLVRDKLNGNGDPILYGRKEALIVGIDIFDTYSKTETTGETTLTRYAGSLNTNVQVTVTQGTPANWSNLGALASGLLGLKTQGTGAGQANYGGFIAVACQKGTKSLPFDLAINETVNDGSSSAQNAADNKSSDQKTPTAPAAGNVTCSGTNETTPCAMSRTFTSTDKEYWDVSMGVAIPGVRETGFTFNSSSNSVSRSTTTHTEAYAFLDLYLLAAKASKDSGVPHINLGVPVSSKVLYRPYFGLAENLTGWSGLQQKLQLPTSISFFAGMCWMKTQQLVGPTPTSQSDFNSELSYHRVWKPMFGVEVSISSLASKLGGKSSKNSNGKSSTSSGSGGQ